MLLAYIALNYNKSASHFDLHLNEGRLRTKNVFNFFILKFQFICKKKSSINCIWGVVYLSISWCDIPKLLFPFRNSSKEGCWKQGSKGFSGKVEITTSNVSWLVHRYETCATDDHWNISFVVSHNSVLHDFSPFF